MQTREWRPTKRQEDFLSLPDSIFEAMYGGAAGGGKTETLLMLPLVRQFYTHPRFKMLFLRRTFPELDSEVIPRSKEFYPAAGFNPYQDQKKRWVHPSGSIIQFGHCEHEKDVVKYDTSQYNIIAFDELTSFTEYQYIYLSMSRCRSAESALPALVRTGTNPGNIGHGFVRKRFVEPCRTGNTIIRESRLLHGVPTVIQRIYIPSKATDNTYLMAADPTYINRLNLLPAAERAAKLDGDWWTFSGQVFDEFRVAPFPDEPPYACHVIPEFQIPSYWPRVLSIDWGYSAMTIAGWYAINPCPDEHHRASFYKYREYSCKKTKISTWAADIARLSQGETFVDVVLDPSAWSSRGDEYNIAEQFEAVSKLRPRKADNDRIGGKMLLQDLLRFKQRPPRVVPQEGFDQETADRLSRQYGPKGLLEYAALFQAEPEELLPKFQVFESCEETIKAIPLCVYDKDRKEDVAEFEGDDPYDETRYGIKACQYYTDSGVNEHNRVQQVAGICSRLEQAQDSPSAITKFYIDMGNLEAQGVKTNRPIRRFHGSGLRHANF